jgi:hypothetical protein
VSAGQERERESESESAATNLVGVTEVVHHGSGEAGAASDDVGRTYLVS